MTKTLTKQWRDGKLPEDTYYVRFICGRYGVYEFEQYKGFGFDNDLAYIKEVLAPVPSYDEWQAELASNDELLNVQKRLEKKIKLLEEQLNNALETMGQVAKLSDNTVDSVQCAHAICLINERLKEIEGVK